MAPVFSFFGWQWATRDLLAIRFAAILATISAALDPPRRTTQTSPEWAPKKKGKGKLRKRSAIEL
jgi:hypothetical protein